MTLQVTRKDGRKQRNIVLITSKNTMVQMKVTLKITKVALCRLYATKQDMWFLKIELDNK